MDRDGDGIDDELAALIRTAIAFASRAAEEYARHREQQARRAEAESERRRAEYQSRIDAERAAARAQLAPVLRDEWWKRVTPERIGTAYEAASNWAQYDDVAQQAADRIREEVKARYDVDIDELARDALTTRTSDEIGAGKQIDELDPDERRLSYLQAQRWLAEADADRSERIGLQVLEADTEAASVAAQNEAIKAHRRHLAELEGATGDRRDVGQDLAEAHQVVDVADAVDQAADAQDRAVHERADQIVLGADRARTDRIIEEMYESLADFDTAERREKTAESLEVIGDPEGLESRMLDDISNAHPPAAAVSRRRHPRARKTRGLYGHDRELGQER